MHSRPAGDGPTHPIEWISAARAELDALPDTRSGLGVALGLWTALRVEAAAEHLSGALAAMVLIPPFGLSQGQEEMAWFEAFGQVASDTRLGSRCPPSVRVEHEKVHHRAELIREALSQ